MFTRILNVRSWFALAALSIIFGSSTANAQTAKPVMPQRVQEPAGQTRNYEFTLDSFQILRTRSRFKDTDHVSFSLKVGDKVYPAKVKHVGDVDNGTHKVNLTFDNVNIPTPETKVVLTYLIMNSGHDKDQISKLLQKGTEELLKREVTVGGEWGEVISYVEKIGISVLFPNCDGWVAGDHVTLTGKKLAEWGAGHKETKEFHGLNSAAGCGKNSIYKVTWSVKQK